LVPALRLTNVRTTTLIGRADDLARACAGFLRASSGRARLNALGRLGLVVVLGLTIAACTPGNEHRSHSGAAEPRYGGTLRLVGDSDVDHLDTASAYDGTTYTVERAFTRQLVTYPATGIDSMPTKLVPDLAVDVPTVDDGGVTDGGTTYTYHLRHGAMWGTSPARQVTAEDVVRGIERLCNPVQPTGAPGYYESTVRGMTAYCNSFLRVPGNVSAIRAFMATHDLVGVHAVDPRTVVFHLTRPASDFNNIMALPFSSPVPVEYLNYLPGSSALAQHTLSDGPYRIAAYRPGISMTLVRSPSWQQDADPVRHDYVDRIEVSETVSPGSALLQLEAGSADLQWEGDLPLTLVDRLIEAHDPRLVIYSAWALDPYLVINFQSPNASRATSKLQVRQALEYAVDKAHVVQASGGQALNAPLDQVITRGNAGYRPFDLYPSSAEHGNPGKARALLAAAGYPHGLALRLLYPSDSSTTTIEQVLQPDLARAGITVVPVPATVAAFYGVDVVTPSSARSGEWDIALASWGPDWFGNNGRTTVQPLLDGSNYGLGSADYGDYNNSAEDGLISRALAAPAQGQAAALWHQADVHAMADASIVPLDAHERAVFHSTRVQHFRVDPVSWQGDVTALWLAP
jgi:ABC-type transport system substrate-binding protein